MVHSSITLKAYQSVVESSESGAHARTKATFRYTLHKDENVTRAQEESVRYPILQCHSEVPTVCDWRLYC